jgi:hypothetical protein
MESILKSASDKLISYPLQKTKTWNNVMEYFEQKWQFVANVKQRIRIFFTDVKGRQSVDMLSTFPSISVGETLSLHPAVLAFQNCSSSPKDKASLVSESDVLIIQMFYCLKIKELIQSSITLDLTTNTRGGMQTLKSEIVSRGPKIKKHSSPKGKSYPSISYEGASGRPRAALIKLQDENQHHLDLTSLSTQNSSHRNTIKEGKAALKRDANMASLALQHLTKPPIEIFSSEFSQSLWNQGDCDSFAHAHSNGNGNGNGNGQGHCNGHGNNGTLDFSMGASSQDFKMFESNIGKSSFNATSAANQLGDPPYAGTDSIFSPVRTATEMGNISAMCDMNDCTQDIIDGIANGLIHLPSSCSNAPLSLSHSPSSPSPSTTRALFDRIILCKDQHLPLAHDGGFKRVTADDVIASAPTAIAGGGTVTSPVSLRGHTGPIGLDSGDAFTYNISACELPSDSLVMCDGGGISGSRDVTAFNVSDPFHDIDFPFSEVKERKDYPEPLFFFSNIGNGFSFRHDNPDSPQGIQRIGTDRSDIGFSNDLDMLMGGQSFPELPSVEDVCVDEGMPCPVNRGASTEPLLTELAKRDQQVSACSSFPSSTSAVPATSLPCQPFLASPPPSLLQVVPVRDIDYCVAPIEVPAAPPAREQTSVRKAGIEPKRRIRHIEAEIPIPVPVIPAPTPASVPASASAPVPVPVPVHVADSHSVPVLAKGPHGAAVKTSGRVEGVGSAGAENDLLFSPLRSAINPSAVASVVRADCAPSSSSVKPAAICADSERSESAVKVMQKVSAVRLFGFIEQIDEIRYRDDCERRSPLLCGAAMKGRSDSGSVSTKSISTSNNSCKVTSEGRGGEMKQEMKVVDVETKQRARQVQEERAAMKEQRGCEETSEAICNLLNEDGGIGHDSDDHGEKEKNRDSLSGLSTSRKDIVGSRPSTTPPAAPTFRQPISLPPLSSSSPPFPLHSSSDVVDERRLCKEVPKPMSNSSTEKMRASPEGHLNTGAADLVLSIGEPAVMRKKRDRESDARRVDEDEDEEKTGACKRAVKDDVINSPNTLTDGGALKHVQSGTGTVKGTGKNQGVQLANGPATVINVTGPSPSQPSTPSVPSSSYLFPLQAFHDTSSDSNSTNGAGSSDGSSAGSVKNIRITENFRLFYTEINDMVTISSRIKSRKDLKMRKRITPTFLVPLSMKEKYLEHLVFMNTFQ